MQKLLHKAVVCLFVMIFSSSQPVICAAQDPAEFIKEFYTWYISAQIRVDATRTGSDIYRYVAHETVEGIKIIPGRPGYDGTDYFIKLSDTPVDMKGVSILVNQVETIGHDTFVATVVIVHIDETGHRFPDGVVVVVLKRIKGELKIFKCIDSYPEA